MSDNWCRDIEAKVDALAKYLGVKIEWCNHQNNGWKERGCKECDGTGVKITTS